ncbi:MAG: primase [Betaproteobacteria bacterium]|nr:primase [Betaproteobacteria bacterium]
MIPQSFIQDLLNRVDIVDVVERYVPLKKAGANFVACCPFHGEKTPSFTVSQSKQFYHCFGCGAHGTAIGFMIEYGGVGFIDAVKDLAQSAGMQMPEFKAEKPHGKTEEGDDLYAIMLKAAHYYRGQLKNAPHAIEYLKKRGLSGEIAKEFGIGYAPDGWQNLQAEFPDYNSKALVAAGLVIQGDEGKRYDRFRDRVMFPIVDQRGNVIGFGGRVLDKGEPKYLNSPETPLFEKGRELYGLYQGRRAIRDAERVIVVEGYMDVVALAQSGIGYAVATLGTATTPTHVQKLLRQVDDVVFCFDGDDAGRRAAWRALENSLDQLADGKQLSFLFLPQGEDPDTYVRKLGKDAFEKMLGDAKPLSQFLIDELKSRVDLTTGEGRAALLKEAKPLVMRITARFLGRIIRQNLAQVAGLDVQDLEREYGIKETRPVKAGPARGAATPVRGPARKVIQLLVLRPELHTLADRGELAGAHGVGTIRQDEIALLESLLDVYEQSTATRVGEHFRGTEFEAVVSEIEASVLKSAEADFDAAELENQFADDWHNLHLAIEAEVRHDRRAVLQQKLAQKQALSAEEQDEYRALLQPQRSTQAS